MMKVEDNGRDATTRWSSKVKVASNKIVVVVVGSDDEGDWIIM